MSAKAPESAGHGTGARPGRGWVDDLANSYWGRENHFRPIRLQAQLAAASVKHTTRTLSGPPSTRASIAMDGGCLICRTQASSKQAGLGTCVFRLISLLA